MALQNNFQIGQDLINGAYITFVEATGNYNPITNPGGYGSPNPDISTVHATRLIFGDYFSILSSGGSINFATPYVEYIGIGNPVVDSKKIFAVPGVTNIFVVGGGVTGGTLSYTGRSEYSGSFLPGQGSVNLLPPQVEQLQLAGASSFPDTIMQCQYEIYGGSAVSSGSIANGTQYIVTGTGTVTYNNSSTPGGVYRVGEVFQGVFGVTTFTTSGSPVVYPLMSAVLNYFPLTYQSNLKVRLAAEYIQNAANGSGDMWQLWYQMNTDLNFIENMYLDSTTIAGIDIPLCMTIFNRISVTYQQITGLR